MTDPSSVREIQILLTILRVPRYESACPRQSQVVQDNTDFTTVRRYARQDACKVLWLRLPNLQPTCSSDFCSDFKKYIYLIWILKLLQHDI